MPFSKFITRRKLDPEGARQVEDALAPFKKGPFIFAINSGATILPLVIRGARQAWFKGDILPNSSSLKIQVRARVLKPVSTEAVTLESIEELMNLVRNQMQVAYDNLN